MSESAVKSPSRLVGRVVGAKMDKTIRVEISRLVSHPVYGKYIRRSSTVLAHDEKNECREGDLVAVTACRPLSRRKVWSLAEIVERKA